MQNECLNEFLHRNCGGVRLFGVTVNPQKIFYTKRKITKQSQKRIEKPFLALIEMKWSVSLAIRVREQLPKKYISSIFPQIFAEKEN